MVWPLFRTISEFVESLELRTPLPTERLIIKSLQNQELTTLGYDELEGWVDPEWPQWPDGGWPPGSWPGGPWWGDVPEYPWEDPEIPPWGEGDPPVFEPIEDPGGPGEGAPSGEDPSGVAELPPTLDDLVGLAQQPVILYDTRRNATQGAILNGPSETSAVFSGAHDIRLNNTGVTIGESGWSRGFTQFPNADAWDDLGGAPDDEPWTMVMGYHNVTELNPYARIEMGGNADSGVTGPQFSFRLEVNANVGFDGVAYPTLYVESFLYRGGLWDDAGTFTDPDDDTQRRDYQAVRESASNSPVPVSGVVVATFRYWKGETSVWINGELRSDDFPVTASYQADTIDVDGYLFFTDVDDDYPFPAIDLADLPNVKGMDSRLSGTTAKPRMGEFPDGAYVAALFRGEPTEADLAVLQSVYGKGEPLEVPDTWEPPEPADDLWFEYRDGASTVCDTVYEHDGYRIHLIPWRSSQPGSWVRLPGCPASVDVDLALVGFGGDGGRPTTDGICGGGGAGGEVTFGTATITADVTGIRVGARHTGLSTLWGGLSAIGGLDGASTGAGSPGGDAGGSGGAGMSSGTTAGGTGTYPGGAGSNNAALALRAGGGGGGSGSAGVNGSGTAAGGKGTKISWLPFDLWVCSGGGGATGTTGEARGFGGPEAGAGGNTFNSETRKGRDATGYGCGGGGSVRVSGDSFSTSVGTGKEGVILVRYPYP